MPSLSRPRLVALYLVVIGVWGTTWIAIKASVDTIPPLTASGLRFAIAFPLRKSTSARRASARSGRCTSSGSRSGSR
jgi:drug/metabolite transporter (DMT)-like permease